LCDLKNAPTIAQRAKNSPNLFTLPSKFFRTHPSGKRAFNSSKCVASQTLTSNPSVKLAINKHRNQTFSKINKHRDQTFSKINKHRDQTFSKINKHSDQTFIKTTKFTSGTKDPGSNPAVV
jgi:hypothetical protein